MKNKYYDIAKWIVITVLPAISVFIMTIGTTIGIKDPENVTTIINAFTVLLGTILGVSSIKYQKGVESNNENNKKNN